MFACNARNASYPTSNVDRCWAGALTSTSFKVVADIDQPLGNARLLVSPNSDFSSPAYTSPYQAPTITTGSLLSYRTYSFSAVGLAPDTLYYYRVESQGAPNHAAVTRTAKTAPSGAGAFSFSAGSCDHFNPAAASAALARIQLYRAMATEGALFFLHIDDMLYTDISSTTIADHRDLKMRNWLRSPEVNDLMKILPIAYTPGDHDLGPNDSTLDTTNGEAIFRISRAHHREIVPCYPFAQETLGETNIDHVTLAQQFDIGKVRFLMPDGMSQSRKNVSCLGQGLGNGDYWDQLTWLGTALTQAATDGMAWVFLVLSRSWNGYDQTCFNDFFTGDRQAISDMIEACAVPVCLFVGDAHCAGFDDGTNSAAFTTDGFGFFPHIQASGLFNEPVPDVSVFNWNGDNTYVGNPSGAQNPGDGQYVLVSVASDNLSWSASIKGVPINQSTMAPSTLKSISSTDATPAVSFNNAAPSVAHGSALTVNLDKTWFGVCSVHWASSDGQSGNISFLPNKKRASFTITFVSAGAPTITLSSPSGCTISGANPITVTVT